MGAKEIELISSKISNAINSMSPAAKEIFDEMTRAVVIRGIINSVLITAFTIAFILLARKFFITAFDEDTCYEEEQVYIVVGVIFTVISVILVIIFMCCISTWATMIYAPKAHIIERMITTVLTPN